MRVKTFFFLQTFINAFVLQIYAKHTENEMSKSFKKAVKTQQGLVTVSSSAEGTQHSYSEEETVAFTNWIKKVWSCFVFFFLFFFFQFRKCD